MNTSAPAGERKKTSADLLVTGGMVLTMDESGRSFQPGAIAIIGPDIVAVGPQQEMLESWDAARVVDAKGCVVMPGLINAHTHAAMTIFRGLADDLPLLDWLQGSIFPAERLLTGEWVYWGTLLACAEMIRSGTTCFCDMYLFENMTARAAKHAGVRALVGEVLYDFPSPNYGKVENGIPWSESLIDEWAGDPLVRVAVEPHAPYTCSPDLLRRCRDLSERRSVPLVVHLSETESEVARVIKAYGRRPVAHLESLGLLSRRLIAPHCVAIDNNDIELLACREVQVVHNPESNMKLASGIAPVPRLLSMGVNVAIGTDGCASNNNLDMFGEMDTCAKLHKVATMDPTVLPAGTVLRMATRNGAAALGMAGTCGELSPGARADFIIVDFSKPHLVPVYSHESHLVYAAGGADVRDTFIHGRQVMANRELLTIDLEEVTEKVRELSGIVVRSTGAEGRKGPGDT